MRRLDNPILSIIAEVLCFLWRVITAPFRK